MSARAQDLLILAAAVAVSTLVALAAGATNLGTALTFGQLGFAGTLVYVLTRR